ncbi:MULTISPECIES: hypothetical protein [Pseudomonas syringae group]|uniref:Uncharacterized protein n=1 Tax=Pseudomonas syringae pv. persicae TaxID=237306 RepID=A0A3M3ZTJ6_9PSED|nr:MULTISPECIES: hypothetical protein [Pseudomonas syringae group]QOQ33555.1 hypothetical protein [Pseudomonas syringae pv. actinidiae]RMO97942.1 hypothetical protein ALQ30_200655 [Pseudomonas syringae pv. persicae]
MARAKKTHTAELVKVSAEFPALIDAMEAEIQALSYSMARLDKAGRIYASEHWRKGKDGEPKYFYLLYVQKPGEARKREYIGCDLRKIKKARAAIKRGREYDELRTKLLELEDRIYHVQHAMSEARRYLTSERRSYSY